jgi:hypothetical protein
VKVPVGGADKLATFVSLLGGNQLDVAVLMDVSSNSMQRINRTLSGWWLVGRV